VALFVELCETHIVDIRAVLANMVDPPRVQNTPIRSVVERFGCHPHCNVHDRRILSADKESSIASGNFPHFPQTQLTNGS
jgi:hypothetical protein